MNPKVIDLEKLELWIPRLWEKDWQNAINNASGIEKDLLIIQNRAANLLSQISDKRVTFARLAWLNLWTKLFSTLEGAFCAIPKNSLYVLRMLGRASFEQALHAKTIMEPILNAFSDLKDSKERVMPKSLLCNLKKRAVNRLEAYAAWCIWNDLTFYERLVCPETLDAAWDAEPAQKILRNLERLEAYESVYSQLKIETDEKELKKGRLRQQDEGRHELHRLRKWLDHPDLKGWHEKLKKSKKNNPMTFFTLVGEDPRGVPKTLKEFDLYFGYSLYFEGSMAIHGSSLYQFLHLGNKSAMPLLAGTDDEVSGKAEEIGGNCSQVIIALIFLGRQIWPKQERPDCSSKDNSHHKA